MSLKLGNTSIGSLYLGSTKVGAAYLGNVKVYESGVGPKVLRSSSRTPSTRLMT